MTERPGSGAAPLDGVVVVSLEQAVAAPLATRHLADLGATVVKIERPGGDLARHYDTKVAGQSSFFVWANRAKQSVELDLNDPGQRERFDRMVAAADVFFQNLSPAAADRAGLGADHLHERHPRLVAVEISGYGRGGPMTDDKAYDLAIQAEAGAMALTGSEHEMSKVGFSAADIAAGMYALSSTLAALHRRQRTGEGAAISISMLECLAEWTAPQVYAAAATGDEPVRVGNRHALIAPYGLYGLADGTQVMVAVQANHEWVAFASAVLDRPDLVDDERFATNEARIADIDALEVEIRHVFDSVPAPDVLSRLRDARIAHGRARTPLEVWNHDQLRARDRFRPLDVATGRTLNYLPPFNISGLPEPVDRVPALDEHDADLVARLLDEEPR